MGNRDEFHQRAATPLGMLDNDALLVGGRDLERQGGWLWAAATGRLATVTNVRRGDRASSPPAARSRGELVADFTASDLRTEEFLHQLRGHAPEYGPFNLVLWDGQRLGYASNAPHAVTRMLDPGVYAVSNGALDEPWPKTIRVRDALERWLDAAGAARGEVEPLLAALRDDRPAKDEELPDTGVGLALERRLGAPFVAGTSYGTRCSSVVRFTQDELSFTERRFDARGERTGDTVITVPRRPAGAASPTR